MPRASSIEAHEMEHHEQPFDDIMLLMSDCGAPLPLDTDRTCVEGGGGGVRGGPARAESGHCRGGDEVGFLGNF